MIHSLHSAFFLAQSASGGGGGGGNNDFITLIDYGLGFSYIVVACMAFAVIVHGFEGGMHQGHWMKGLFQGVCMLGSLFIVSELIARAVPGAPTLHMLWG